jgi:hypothetical protein
VTQTRKQKDYLDVKRKVRVKWLKRQISFNRNGLKKSKWKKHPEEKEDP